MPASQPDSPHDCPRKSCDVVVFGDLFIDQVMTGFRRLPSLGEEALATGFRREIGGGAAITACGLAGLGARVKVIGTVGAEELGWFRQKFEFKGVDAKALMTHPSEPTAITVAVSTVNDRIFYTYAGANTLLPSSLTDPSTRAQMAAARHVHFAHAMESQRLLELTNWLHQQGCTVSVDVGWDEAWLADPAILKALAEVDWFFPNEREAARMTGETDPQRALESFGSLGLPGVALKLGPQGATVLFRGDIIQGPPPLSVNTIDTTGAGDCFDAGFLSAWLDGKPIQECLAWGNACGALSTRCSGGSEGFPSREEMLSALRKS